MQFGLSNTLTARTNFIKDFVDIFFIYKEIKFLFLMHIIVKFLSFDYNGRIENNIYTNLIVI
jgi:hypothetical protein